MNDGIREIDPDDMQVLPFNVGDSVTEHGVTVALMDEEHALATLEGDERDPVMKPVTTPQGKHLLCFLHPDTDSGVGIAMQPDGSVVGWVPMVLLDLDPREGDL